MYQRMKINFLVEAATRTTITTATAATVTTAIASATAAAAKAATTAGRAFTGFVHRKGASAKILAVKLGCRRVCIFHFNKAKAA
jgi:hypothetical protein